MDQSTTTHSNNYYFQLIIVFLLLLLPIAYEKSHSFRYYFKFLVYYVMVSFFSCILIPPMIFRPCNVKNLVLASSMCRHISTIIGLKWELRGKEHLEKERACIIVANHQSSLDVLGMFDIWAIMEKCTVVAKRELFYAWPFGLGAWLCGLIFINRMHSDKARHQLNDATNRIKQKNIKLWVFPEGTRRNTGELHPFKKGAFHVAINAQLPILPVVFSSYRTFLHDDKKILNSGRIIITTLPPIPTEGLTINDIESLMERTRSVMNEQYKLTSNEIQHCYNQVTPGNSQIYHDDKPSKMVTTKAAAAKASDQYCNGTTTDSNNIELLNASKKIELNDTIPKLNFENSFKL